jgi:hypothetical protein
MPTLRRILKYTPAVVMGLLVVAWVVSPFVGFALGRNGANRFVLEVSGGDVWFYPWSTNHVIGGTNYMWFTPPHPTYSARFQSPTWFIIGFPLPFLLTLMVPISIGSFTCFRFRLWHYLAYTALVAVELAFYLRWQA